MIKLTSIFLGLLILLCSCQPKDHFDWGPGFSAPKNYIAGGPMVEYFYQGKSLAGTSSNVGINPGWGVGSGGYVGGDKYKPVPDSMRVRWRCGTDLIEYEAGLKLPREKMLKLFRDRYSDKDGKKIDYSLILTGMAPGGNVTVWLSAGPVNTEILKFKAKAMKKYNRMDENSVTLWSSTGPEAKETLKYLSIHGVPYKVWEKGEKEYPYCIEFSSRENFGFALNNYCKDGSLFMVNDSLNFVKWKDRFDKFTQSNNVMLKRKLPVQIHIQWFSENKTRWFEGDIVMPQNLESIFNTGKYNRMLVCIEKDTGNSSLGSIYVTGKNSRYKVMDFQLGLFNRSLKKLMAPKFSLPKNYRFPTWEGPPPLSDLTSIDYWQEK